MRSCTAANISQSSAATDLRSGSFNSGLLYSSFPNLAVKNYENWYTFTELILRKSGLSFMRHQVYAILGWTYHQHHLFIFVDDHV